MKLTKKTLKIRELNDEFRSSPYDSDLGKLLLTDGVRNMPSIDKMELIRKIVNFNEFNKNNDTYGEHDFGSVNFKDEKYFFKIDYYDKNLEFHSEDATDPSKTTRVMTIMNAEEY